MIVNSKTRQFQKLKGAEKLILGTVQLGLNYGINNISGKPALEESFKILDIIKIQVSGPSNLEQQ